MVDYFFDSYAIIEMLKGNKNYSRYFKKPIVITIFNLAEIYWAILKNFDKEKADNIYEYVKEFVVEISDEVMKKAMKFKIKNKKRNLSYADCIGYTYAIKNGLLFLTGDKEFENLKNVEFVKQ